MKSKKIPGFNKKKLVKSYMKSNYRIVGSLKHSALKPCHWQEQKLLTGRANRNCYKGYFGIESESCIQNTPSLPFCNHQCVFCWRDFESASFGPVWKGDYDSPKEIVREMIRHNKNLIFHHIKIKKSLKNLELMHEILYKYLEVLKDEEISENDVSFTEREMTKHIHSTRVKTHRALLLLKSCNILSNKVDDIYILEKNFAKILKSKKDVDELISKEVTTKEEIEKVFKNAENPKHAAISLAGEPTLYPKIGEMVEEFRKRGMSTFIVTNGTHPDVIKRLHKNNQLPTQLYVTLTAPTKKLFNKISRPMTKNAWEKLMETLDLLPNLPCRTVVRITSVNFLNIDLDMVPDYVKILSKSTPDFIDIKGFTLQSAASEIKNRLGHFKSNHNLLDYSPNHEDLLLFAKELQIKGNFEIIEEHVASRDILLRGKWPKNRSIKIDFSKINKIK